MSSSNLINLMTLIWNLPLNFDVAFCNWLDKFLPPTMALINNNKLMSIVAYLASVSYSPPLVVTCPSRDRP